MRKLILLFIFAFHSILNVQYPITSVGGNNSGVIGSESFSVGEVA